MKLDLFIHSLEHDEKLTLFNLLHNYLFPDNKKQEFTKLLSVDEFCDQFDLSTRLKNVLLSNKDYLGNYIETIDAHKILMCRNAGKDTKNEFITIRKYYLEKKNS